MPVTRAKLDDVGDFDAFVGQMVNGVGVVPLEPEIGGRVLNRAQTPDYFIGIDNARRIAVLRNAPHSLDGWVLGCELLDRVHIWTIFPERYRDHPDPVVFTDFEMPVIAWHGTQKRHLVKL